jgi:flagellin-like protein
MKALLARRRGLSELVAAILLVFIVVTAGTIVYYAFTYRYSSLYKSMAREKAGVEETLLEADSLTILYAVIEQGPAGRPTLRLALGTGLKPPVIGAIYVNGSMAYNGELRLPCSSLTVLELPVNVEAGKGDIILIELASTSGVVYRASGYVA